jgi:hypothetical protein
MGNHLLPLLFAAATTFAPFAAAQCFDTVFGQSLGSGPDFVFPQQSIGFAFPLGGTTYSNVHVCDKGYLFLSNGGVPAPGTADLSASAAELASLSPRIAVLWSDLVSLPAVASTVHVKSTPQQCTISWRRLQCFGSSCAPFDLQVRLFPSGVVECVYGAGATNNSTAPPWSVGVVGISPGGIAVPPAPQNLAVAGSTTSAVVHEVFTVPNSFDLPASGVRFTPQGSGWSWAPLGPAVNCATVTEFGTSCGGVPTAVCQVVPAALAAAQLGNLALRYQRSPSGYQLARVFGPTFVPPTAAATVVANGNNVEQTVTLPSPMPIAGGTTPNLVIGSNGYVGLGTFPLSAASGMTPATFGSLLTPTIAAAWHDLDPTLPGSGPIRFEVVGTTAYVTWTNVAIVGPPAASDTFQVQLDLANGDITVVYLTLGSAGGDYFAGYTRGNGTDPVLQVQFANLPPIPVGDVAVPSMKHGATSTPFLGNSQFGFLTNNVPGPVPVLVLVLGDTPLPAGVPLAAIGMGLCQAYGNGNLLSLPVPVTLGNSTTLLPIANNPALVGISLTSQVLAFSPTTPLGLISSNGMQMTVGL